MITRAIAFPKIVMIQNKDKFIADSNKGYIKVISIIDPDSEPVFNEDTDNIRTFFFHDIEPIGCCTIKMPYIPMNNNQSEQIFDFIKDAHESDHEVRFIVNCSAGICRSGAVVEFIRRFAALDDIKFTDDNPNIRPNLWVLNQLCNQWLQHDMEFFR